MVGLEADQIGQRKIEIHGIAQQLRHHFLDVVPCFRNLQAKRLQNVPAVVEHLKILRLDCAVDAIVVVKRHKGFQIVLLRVKFKKIVVFRQILRRAANGKVEGRPIVHAKHKIRAGARGIREDQLLLVRHDGQADVCVIDLIVTGINKLLKRLHILDRAVDPHGQLAIVLL